MEDSPCPNCGYRRQRYTMSSDTQDDVTLREIWGGALGVIQAFCLRIAVYFVLFLVVSGVFHALHIH